MIVVFFGGTFVSAGSFRSAPHHLSRQRSGRLYPWYEQLLGAKHLTSLDHYTPQGEWFAAVLAVPGLDVPLQLRVGEPVSVPAGFEPVTFSVRDRADLDAWVAHLDALGVPHPPVTTARVGDSVQFTSPDGTPLRLYTGSVDLGAAGSQRPQAHAE
jgi:catechol 2,3-dioxygenase-like lactoylglutathione lyase family enzyme